MFTLPGYYLILFKARRGTLPFCWSHSIDSIYHSSLRFSCVCVMHLYLAWAKEDISIWPENQRSKAFTFYTTSPINWGMGIVATSSVRDLLQCWVRRETAIQQNDGVDMLPLELGLLRASILCLSGARSSANMPGNAALWAHWSPVRTSEHERWTF